MGNTVKVFDYEIDINGASIIVRREPLMGGCHSDGEVDANIQLLKDNLDAVAKRMKVAISSH